MEKSFIDMPKNSEIIRIDGFDGAIWVWAIVDTDNELVRRNFELFKTGGEMPNDIGDYVYHGCGAIFIQMELMMYVFERPNSETLAEQPTKPFDWKDHQES